jgi:hypothetical protein
MSHFTTIKTRFCDAQALLQALNDLGLKTVEVHETAEHLYGFMGDKRKQTAEIIIRRKYVGRMSNDLGFKRGTDGTFTAIISGYDRSKYDARWLAKLTQRYGYHVACHKLTEQGFDLVKEETQADGRIHLVLRRMA